jgi:hypothetical protein
MLVAIMPKSIPLGTRLGIEGKRVVVDCAWGFVGYSVAEFLAAEGGEGGEVKGPVEGYAVAGLDFFCGFFDDWMRDGRSADRSWM